MLPNVSVLAFWRWAGANLADNHSRLLAEYVAAVAWLKTCGVRRMATTSRRLHAADRGAGCRLPAIARQTEVFTHRDAGAETTAREPATCRISLERGAPRIVAVEEFYRRRQGNEPSLSAHTSAKICTAPPADPILRLVHMSCAQELTKMHTDTRNRTLVIEDDPDVRLLWQESLERANFDVVVAAGGAEGLQRLREDKNIGLVLLDLVMPDVDGWRFLAAQRADPRLAQIPTVVLSGCIVSRDVAQRVSGHLQKPVWMAELLSVVGAYCTPRASAGR